MIVHSLTMYQCQNSSKCISKRRLLDGLQDCPLNDDETYQNSCALPDAHQRLRCSDDQKKEKCIASLAIRDSKKHCHDGLDESSEERWQIEREISFQTICDGKRDLLPLVIGNESHTDETDCDYWQCNNTYSRCDQFWLCSNGADEINCLPSKCPPFEHDCVFYNETSKVSCLPMMQAGDGNNDCLGGTDERRNYSIRRETNFVEYEYRYRCWNQSKQIHISDLCNKRADCRFADDESTFCQTSSLTGSSFCSYSSTHQTEAGLFLCNFGKTLRQRRIVYFKIANIDIYPSQINIDYQTKTLSSLIDLHLSEKKDRTDYKSSDYHWWCNRGIPLRFRLNDNTSKLSCLCPPSYYGQRCEYQNQRISLTIQIRVQSDWRTRFLFLITLIDNERNIQSHDYIQYTPVLDCRDKFHIYLLYSTRPKNLSTNYFIHIDAFTQLTFNYRGSWSFPIQFPFLPVHHLPVLLTVPVVSITSTHQCWPPCVNGQCFNYINNASSAFCRCKSGWFGIQCNRQYLCHCAPDSLCISKSICLCPPGRFGRRCYLSKSVCHSESCLNGGQCESDDVRYTSKQKVKAKCTCPAGYQGDRCELEQKQTRIHISFHRKVTIPSSLLLHFIAIQNTAHPNRTSMMYKIGFSQYSLTVYTSVWFNLALAQVVHDYYLIVLHEQRIPFATIVTEVIPSRRCQSVVELFNETFLTQHLIKRIKSYHLPCQKQHNLVCFYDELHLCLCTRDRTVNCLKFDHNLTHTCGKSHFCANEGYCFQTNLQCPQPPICVCRQCYFGSRCQFSTKGSILSLDIILNYHIHPAIAISRQAVIVKIAIVLTTILFTFGSLSSLLTYKTFQQSETCTNGCGLYLFTSSIASMTTIIVLTVKFCFLLTFQIGSINNRFFLYIQCALIDYLLRVLLSINDWLSACVAIERATNVIQGIKSSQRKSKQTAKWLIAIVVFVSGCTYIYDPFHRRLVNDEEEQRMWCISVYSSSIQIFDSVINIFHFLFPFTINCISAVIVIIGVARTRSNSQKQKSFGAHLYEQLQDHKHILISPMILILLAVPRLVISFVSGCMKSARDSWFYLIGYFISFIPSMMTFVVFVLPSELYKTAFSQSWKRSFDNTR